MVSNKIKLQIMKIIPWLLFIILTTFGCKKDESPSSHKLKNCKIEYLFFRDDIHFSNFQTLNFPPADSFSVCSYSYDSYHLSRITGGFIQVPAGTNLANYIFSDLTYDSVSAGNNTFYLFSKVKTGNGIIFEHTPNASPFLLDSENKIVKIHKNDGLDSNGYDLNYIYSENLITEAVNNGVNNRKFYFENKNLVSVITERYNPTGVLYWKKEIIFQDFDNKPNPFKNMFYVKGAFFRAFSENNYQSYTINTYGQLSDSTFGIYSTYKVSMPLFYNSDGYPKFGDYE